jgi:hypothetical protein
MYISDMATDVERGWTCCPAIDQRRLRRAVGIHTRICAWDTVHCGVTYSPRACLHSKAQCDQFNLLTIFLIYGSHLTHDGYRLSNMLPPCVHKTLNNEKMAAQLVFFVCDPNSGASSDEHRRSCSRTVW